MLIETMVGFQIVCSLSQSGVGVESCECTLFNNRTLDFVDMHVYHASPLLEKYHQSVRVLQLRNPLDIALFFILLYSVLHVLVSCSATPDVLLLAKIGEARQDVI